MTGLDPFQERLGFGQSSFAENMNAGLMQQSGGDTRIGYCGIGELSIEGETASA